MIAHAFLFALATQTAGPTPSPDPERRTVCIVAGAAIGGGAMMAATLATGAAWHAQWLETSPVGTRDDQIGPLGYAVLLTPATTLIGVLGGAATGVGVSSLLDKRDELAGAE